MSKLRSALARALVKAKRAGIGVVAVDSDDEIIRGDIILKGWLESHHVTKEVSPYPDALRGFGLYPHNFSRESKGHWQVCCTGRWGHIYVVKHGRLGSTKIAVFMGS